jgi:integral membrane protein (TIGR01906 family)
MKKVISFLVAAILPFFLLMSAIRILFNPFYLQIEYRAPNFPPDPYGFTTAERLQWGTISIQYITHGKELSFLADQRLPNGKPLYNERELSHMLDVQIVFMGMVTAWWIVLAVLIALGILAWRTNMLAAYIQGLSSGGWATLGLIATILLAVVISFRELFTLFHRLFFTGDSWLFEFSDSLIRLFPLQLWQDAFILVGVISALGGLLCILSGRALLRRLSK